MWVRATALTVVVLVAGGTAAGAATPRAWASPAGTTSTDSAHAEDGTGLELPAPDRLTYPMLQQPPLPDLPELRR